MAALRDLAPSLPVLLVTGAADRLGADDILRAGASGVLATPFGLTDLAREERVARVEIRGAFNRILLKRA